MRPQQNNPDKTDSKKKVPIKQPPHKIASEAIHLSVEKTAIIDKIKQKICALFISHSTIILLNVCFVGAILLKGCFI